ncbi:hypothetical protein FISHEDRAFT_55210 [Fistulina hepatica ATCC 64428]|uniref:Homeobox domain-containing protein n=1 Tax=Fistulina hepatica ATCC 64428 TaxID=1128425 RepID=A0A0D7APV3_9AGAR|nr:hypothetical protein FISHEDRAFT_55210 [Fistulina hepatica ATCC 64428]
MCSPTLHVTESLRDASHTGQDARTPPDACASPTLSSCRKRAEDDNFPGRPLGPLNASSNAVSITVYRDSKGTRVLPKISIPTRTPFDSNASTGVHVVSCGVEDLTDPPSSAISTGSPVPLDSPASTPGLSPTSANSATSSLADLPTAVPHNTSFFKGTDFAHDSVSALDSFTFPHVSDEHKRTRTDFEDTTENVPPLSRYTNFSDFSPCDFDSGFGFSAGLASTLTSGFGRASFDSDIMRATHSPLTQEAAPSFRGVAISARRSSLGLRAEIGVGLRGGFGRRGSLIGESSKDVQGSDRWQFSNSDFSASSTTSQTLSASSDTSSPSSTHSHSSPPSAMDSPSPLANVLSINALSLPSVPPVVPAPSSPQSPPISAVGLPRKRGKLPKETTDYLKAWLHQHTAHPYPSEEEKKEMCHATGLSMNQVSNWMINARRRILAPARAQTLAASYGLASPYARHHGFGPYPFSLGHDHCCGHYGRGIGLGHDVGDCGHQRGFRGLMGRRHGHACLDQSFDDEYADAGLRRGLGIRRTSEPGLFHPAVGLSGQSHRRGAHSQTGLDYLGGPHRGEHFADCAGCRGDHVHPQDYGLQRPRDCDCADCELGHTTDFGQSSSGGDLTVRPSMDVSQGNAFFDAVANADSTDYSECGCSDEYVNRIQLVKNGFLLLKAWVPCSDEQSLAVGHG